MSVKSELKDVALEALAFVVTGAVMLWLAIYTELGKWPVILLGAAVGIAVVMLIRRRRRS
ncbi:MAG: Loki-CTERM sorting domain-containing protein [Halioglobus sp.]|nr:Loki-CTERM sorting domain-containing protein [Halioglobus sp.]